MAKLGFIGLGIMGDPMARNLLKKGHEVALWSKTPGKAEAVAATGAGKVCATPAEVGAASDCVFYCVGDSAMSRETAIGKDGLIEGAKPGSVIADCSTISPAESRELRRTGRGLPAPAVANRN